MIIAAFITMPEKMTVLNNFFLLMNLKMRPFL